MRSIRVPTFYKNNNNCYSSSSLAVLSSSARSFFGPFKKKQQQQQQPDEQKENKSNSNNKHSNPFAAIPNMPQMPNQKNPIGLAKDVYKMTKAAKQMTKEAQKLQQQQGGGGGAGGMPSNPLQNMTESQMAQFRTMLELQKKMTKEMGGGKIDQNNPMFKLMNSSSEMFEKMLDPMEKGMQKEGRPTNKQIAEEALKGGDKLPHPTSSNFSRGQAHHHHHDQQQHQTNTTTTAPKTNNSSPSSTTNTSNNNNNNNSNPQQQQQQQQQSSSLPPEIEALFQELREMRAKKNQYRDKFNEAEKELTTAKTSLKQAQQHETDLRKRLAAAEHTVALLQSESLELRDKKKELSGQLKQANSELNRSKPTTLSLTEQQKRLENELLSLKKQNKDYQKDVARLERKVSRLRKHSSPINDLSELLQEFSRVGFDKDITLPLSLSATDRVYESSFSNNASSTHLEGNLEQLSGVAGGSSSSSSSSGSTSLHGSHDEIGVEVSSVKYVDGKASLSKSSSSSSSTASSISAELASEGHFRNSVVDEAFSSVRDKYEQLIALRFEQEDSKACEVSSAVVTAATELIRSRVVPHALLDCTLVVPTASNAIDEIKRLVEQFNGLKRNINNKWEVSISENKGLSTSTVTISSSSSSETPIHDLGPFGYFASYYALLNIKNNNNNSNSVSNIIVHPFISNSLINNNNRTKVLTDKARSSKPGGQASNVGETKITHRLVIDGMMVTSATSQDSRSAMENKHTATDRLLNERLPAVNQKLKHLPQLQFTNTSSSTSTKTNDNSSNNFVDEFLQEHRAPSLRSSVSSIEQEFGSLVDGAVKFSIFALKNGKQQI